MVAARALVNVWKKSFRIVNNRIPPIRLVLSKKFELIKLPGSDCVIFGG